MQRVKLIVMTICLLSAVALTGWAQTAGSAAPTNDPARQTSELAAQVRQLTTEVRSLKVELLKLRLETQAAKLAQAEREFAEAQKGSQRMSAQEQQFTQELTEFDERLGQTDLDSSERAQLEVSKAKMTQSGTHKFSVQRHQLLEKQNEVGQRLERERERWQELVKQAGKLGIKVDE